MTRFGLFLIPVILSAADLRVAVYDPSGAVVAGALVTAHTTAGQDLIAHTSDLGEAILDAPPGRTELRVEAAGFAVCRLSVMVKRTGSSVTAKLAISARRDEVSVSVDPREEATNPRGPAFSSVLTEEQIANLPDDPDELEQTLKDMAGPGATIRVDGFQGGRLPHKSQIRSIRFRLTPYSADEHDQGFMLIDILTKPGLGAWHGSGGFGYGGDALNARNALAPAREPQQMRRLDLSLTGPLRRNRTGSSFWFSRNSSYDSKSSIGLLPEGPFDTLVRLPFDATNANARIDQALGKSHVIHGVYEFSRQERANLGAFDLPDRLSTSSQQQHALRLSDTGSLGARLVNEARFQTEWKTTGQTSASRDPSIVVQGAFNRGGAGVQSEVAGRESQLIDHLSFAKGRHAFKTGGEIDVASYTADDASNLASTFTFSSLAAFLAGRPQLYARRQGEASVSFRQFQFGVYAQDDIRLNKQLSLSLGVRYEAQTRIAGHVNFAPRAGVAWSPFRTGRTTIRAGGGIYYQWYAADLVQQTLLLSGSRQADVVIANPGYPDPLSGGATAVPPVSIVRQGARLALPYVVRVSGGVQQQVGKQLMLMTDVRLQRGVDLLYGRNVNAPIPSIGRPDPAAGNILEIDSGASSSMRGFMAGLSPAPGTAFGKRFFWFVNYVYGRSLNETDNPLLAPADSYNRRADWGPSLTDIRHRFAGLAQGSLGHGFQIGTMFRASSAPPYNITTGIDNNGDTILNDRPTGVGRNFARGTGQWDLDTRLAWIRGFGTREDHGGVTRLIRIGEGSRDMPDMPMGGDPNAPAPLIRMQLYTQVFNLMNHANWTSFTGVETSPFFGRPTAALPGRRMEVGIKFSF
jgi:hypothetical protein